MYLIKLTLPVLHVNLGNVSYSSRGLLEVRLLIMTDQYAPNIANEVALDVPRLLGLDDLTDVKVTTKFAVDVMSTTNGSWKIDLDRKKAICTVYRLGERYFLH